MDFIWKRDENHYNNFYMKNKNVWWIEAMDILKESRKLFDINKTFLDLWCGQWRNTFYMANEWFNVEAIDFSQEAINQIDDFIIKEWVKNVKTRCSDLLKLSIDWDFWVIWVINIVSLWERNIALEFINRLKENMKWWTYIVLTWYLQDDIFYEDNKTWLFFRENELLDLFWDFDVKLYKEDSYIDESHEWYNFKHKHSFCKIVAQKL